VVVVVDIREIILVLETREEVVPVLSSLLIPLDKYQKD